MADLFQRVSIRKYRNPAGKRLQQDRRDPSRTHLCQ